MSGPVLRLGTRASPLAMTQAEHVRRQILAILPTATITIHSFSTTGDQLLNQPLTDFGGKGLFTKELEEALLQHHVDLVVHCAKDMPLQSPAGLVTNIVLTPDDPRDCFISKEAPTLETLAPGAVVGTASLRRQAYVKHLRPDLTVRLMRGNVTSRLDKLGHGYDATILALAGLDRLGCRHLATQIFDPLAWVPAIGQGILCLQTRSGDEDLPPQLAQLHDPSADRRWRMERVFMATLNGSCRLPMAAHVTLCDEGDHMVGMVGDEHTLDFVQGALHISPNDTGATATLKIQQFATDLKHRLSQK